MVVGGQLVLQVPKDLQVPKVVQDLKVLKERKELLVILEHRDHLVLQVLLDCQVMMEPQVL